MLDAYDPSPISQRLSLLFAHPLMCLFLFSLQLDRFASIRIPGSKKERAPISHFKQSTSDWSINSSSTTNPFEELSSKITSEKEILALFEKMMVIIMCMLYTI